MSRLSANEVNVKHEYLLLYLALQDYQQGRGLIGYPATFANLNANS